MVGTGDQDLISQWWQAWRRGNGGLAIWLGLPKGQRPDVVKGTCSYFAEQMKQRRRSGRGEVHHI